MSDDVQSILEFLARPSAKSDNFIRRYGDLIDTLASKFGDFCGPNAAQQFIGYLAENQWSALRQWLSQAEKTSFQKFLSGKAEVFFRERRKISMATAMGNTPWALVIEKAEYLPERDRILARYCLVEGLSGAALKKAVRADMHLGLATTGAITTSRSNIVKRLREHCHPDHRDMIDAVLRLRQRSGRRPKAPTRSDTSL